MEAFDEACIGLRALPERHDTRDAGFVGAALEQRELRNVAVDDGDTARLDAEKNLRLGFRDLGERAEEFQMHRSDRRNQRHVRAGKPRQRLDFAGMIHSHFEHRVTRARRTARQR